ncbi:MAG TPA: hypothetical protein VG650_15395 [Mycobacteriales bacterium]|nr:hypothetical protein [Mycobacteriales bacterium]
MSTTRLRRATSVAALALTASGGVGLVSAVSPAAAVTPAGDTPVASDSYSLSIALAQKSIDPGASDTVSGVLTKSGVPQAGDTVYLRERVNGRHHRTHRAAAATTGTDGSVSFTVTPKANTHYRLVFRSADTSPAPTPVPTPVSDRGRVAARSKIVTVHVLRQSSLSIRARDTRRGELIEGQLRGGGHALAGRRVRLQERAVGSETWTTVSTKRTRRHGVVAFRVMTPSAAEELQLGFAGGPNYQGSVSGVVTIG